MRKLLMLACALVVLSSCAYGSMIDEAIEEIEGTLDNLNTAECIRGCTDTAELCLDEANGACVDLCEIKDSQCIDQEDACGCNLSCSKKNSDCNQGCSDQAQECLTVDADCVADCVEELEEALKGIELG